MALPVFVPAVVLSTAAALSVVWPEHGQKFPPVERSFVFGSSPPGSTVTVNGVAIPAMPDGAFLGMVDFSTGAFELKFTAERFGVVESTSRLLYVEPPIATASPDASALEASFLEPRGNLELLPGEIVQVQAKGPPGMRGHFRIKKLARRVPLVEKEGRVRGIYVGHYRLQPDDRGEGLYVRIKLKDPASGRVFKAEANGRLSVRDPRLTQSAVTAAPVTVVRSAPGGGYDLFLPAGVRLTVTGRVQNQAQVSLDRGWSGWVDVEKLRFLPEGTPPAAATIGKDFAVETSTSSTKLLIPTGEKVPFEMRHEQEPYSLAVRFFNSAQRVDRVYFDPRDPVIKDVGFVQESEGVVRVDVKTALKRGWGYDGSYDDRGNFVLEIRRAPAIDAKSPLRGRRIAVDAGHGPDRGGIGPRGSEEKQLNLEIALKTRDLLAREGASVYMIRDSTQGVALADRPGLAWRARAEVYVSIHSNALPVTQDPFSRPRGFMNFYYHPHSRDLAEALNKSYVRHWPRLHDNGVLWGDLSVCRATQMPSVLTETAYIMLPEQEALLRSPDGQQRFARTIVDGLRDFFREASER